MLTDVMSNPKGAKYLLGRHLHAAVLRPFKQEAVPGTYTLKTILRRSIIRTTGPGPYHSDREGCRVATAD